MSGGLRCAFHPAGSPALPPAGRYLLGRVDYREHPGTAAFDGGAPRVGVPLVSAGFDAFTEVWTGGAPPVTGEHRGLVYAHDGDHLFATGHLPARGTYRDAVREAYAAAFGLLGRLDYPHLLRVWNAVGGINRAGEDGLEVYRDFCAGRAEAFAAHAGTVRGMPAATGVGARAGGVWFHLVAARRGPVRHVENPLQVPAYRYPPRYGPRSPSFARATLAGADGSLFVSGTASILGHRTVHPGDLRRQCEVTLSNLAALVGTGNLSRYGAARGHELKDLRFVKVYVRHAGDLAAVREICGEVFPAHAAVVHLHADICRAGLLVEIEGVVPGGPWGDR